MMKSFLSDSKALATSLNTTTDTYNKQIRHDAWTITLLCWLFTNIWAVLRFLHEFPRFTPLMETSKIVGIFAYFGTFAFIDGLLFAGIVIVLAALMLPKRNGLLTQGTVLVCLLTVWWILKLRWALPLEGNAFFSMTAVFIVWATWVAFWCSSPRWEKITSKLLALVNRLVILGYLYLAIDLVCVMIIVVRNVGGLL